MLKKYPAETLEPGDVLIDNDPWRATGQSNDSLIYTPIFVDSRLVAHAGCAAHFVDIGGRFTDIHSRDNYEEELKVPISKLYAKG